MLFSSLTVWMVHLKWACRLTYFLSLILDVYKVYSSSSRQLFTEKKVMNELSSRKGDPLCEPLFRHLYIDSSKYWTHFLRRKEIFFPPLKMDGAQRRPACVLSISFHFRTTLDEWDSSYSPHRGHHFRYCNTPAQVI